MRFICTLIVSLGVKIPSYLRPCAASPLARGGVSSASPRVLHAPYCMLAGENISQLSGFRPVERTRHLFRSARQELVGALGAPADVVG